jgi:PKD domain-containing protein
MRPDLSRLLARLPACARKVWRSVLLALPLAGGVLSASAAIPSNDRCTNAMVIQPNGPFPYFTTPVDITDATLASDPPLPSCQSDISRSVWYTFRPTATDVYRISTCGEAGTGTTVRDTVIAIYTNATHACGSPFFQIPGGCSDDICNKQSEITAILTANVNYFIVVWQYGTSTPAPGQGVLRVMVDRGRPANDDCSNPQPVQLNVPVLGRTLYARNDYDLGNSLCFTGVGQTAVDTPGLEVVFSFTATNTDTYSFKVKNYNLLAEADYDLVLYVSPVCPLPDPGGTINDCLAAANRNLSIAEEVVCLPLTNSQQVFIFVDDRHPNNRGSSFTLEVTRCIPESEPNDSPQPFLFETTANTLPVNDIDYFALGTFTPGSRAFAMIDSVSANQANFDLWVADSNDTLEYDTDNNDLAYGQLSGSVAGTPLRAECAWLRVRYSGGISEPYRLYAVVQPPLSNAVVEIEPNGTIGQAQLSPKNYFSGFLANSSDEDIYAFDAAAGDLIYIGLDADPLRNRTPIDAQLELLNSAGSILMLVDDLAATSNTNTLSGPPFSPAESIVCRAQYTGRYYARVLISPFALASFQGDYLLSISRNGFAGTGGTNTPPQILNVSAPPVAQNSNAVLTATISDPDVGGKFAVSINWGDGTPNTLLNLDVCDYSFQATHQYAQVATYPVTLTAQDIHGGLGSAATSIQVTNVSAASAKIVSIRYQNGSILLQLEGTPNATYRIQWSDNLKDWNFLASRTADSAGRFQFQDNPPLPSRRFYRAVWP